MSERSAVLSSTDESVEGSSISTAMPLTALVIDDSRTGRRIIQTLLAVSGFTVVEAESPAEARIALSNNRFSLITVDRMLGDFDGVDLVSEFRQSPLCGEEPKILALTGHTEKMHREAFFQAGADAFLNKPFTMRDLAEMLEALGFNTAIKEA